MLIIILTFTIMCYIEVPPLIKEGDLRQLIIFCAFFILAFTLWTFFALKLPIINPVKIFEFLIKEVLHLSF